jgi:hypothetical protein
LFTFQERAFLVSQKISEHLVFDGRGMSKADREASAKNDGLWLILTDSPCREAGHRLRTSSGHCIQCDTKKIAFARRHHERGYVYIAASPKAKLIKVGCTRDISHRANMLNVHRYAESDDWKIIAYSKTENMGKVEFEVHAELSSIRASGKYLKDGRWQDTRELFQGKLQKVWDAYRAKTAHVPPADKWQAKDIGKYVFVPGR